VYREGGVSGCVNSAILFDRSGNIACIYDKIYPFWEEFEWTPPACPGRDVHVVETDFGKVGMAICFDANFPSVFKRLSDQGAEIVLWPSAYSAGMSLQAHAINHNFIIVTSTTIPDCLVYDINGLEVLFRTGGENDVVVSRYIADLDRCIFHHDFHLEKRKKLLADHGDEIEMDTELMRERWFTLRAKMDGVSARALAAQYGMEELQPYKRRSEREIDAMRGKK
jgi:hypothetical protein